jgi:Holliday junction DNA helicase RuvA
MIATLNGTVAEKIADMVVLDVHGIGYGLLVSAGDFASLALGANTKLYVYENIKEDTHDLFGFNSIDTKRLFEQLLSVKNVGPKVALAVLNIGNAETVREAIANGDVKLLQTAKGVGKRAAEQMVVELRDKLGVQVSQNAEGIVSRGSINQQDEALQALMALGYLEADAQHALASVDSTLSTEERIKLALKSGH